MGGITQEVIVIPISEFYLFPSDLTTLLTGRYIEISILPFCFLDYYTMEDTGRYADIVFAEYMQYGGFHYLSAMKKTSEKAYVYLKGIYNTVIIKYMEDRQIRRENDPNKRKITDIALLKSIACYLSSVVGSLISVKMIILHPTEKKHLPIL